MAGVKPAPPIPETPAERFRPLVEEIYDWVWEVDEHAIYTYASPRVRDLLGLAPEEVLGRTPFDLMPPEEAQRARALFAPVMARREPFPLLEHTMVAKDGHLVTVETSGWPVLDAQGQFRGYRGVDRDISERKRAEQALRESEARYRALFDAALSAIFVEDLAGNILDVNSRVTELYGYSHEELVGAPLSTVVPEEVYREHPEMAEEVLRTGRLAAEAWGRRKSGEVFPTEVSIRLMQMAGQPRVIVYVRDITERRRAEDALRESEERFRALFLAAPLAIVYLDLEGKVRAWNPAAERMFGWQEEEVRGGPMPYVTPEEEATFMALLERVRRGESIIGEEVRAYRRDGTVIQLSVSTAAVHDSQGRPMGIIGMAEDITARKEAQQALERERAFLSSAVDIIPFPLGFVAPDGTILRTNRASHEHLPGYDPSNWRNAQLLRPDTHTPIPQPDWPVSRALRGEVSPPAEVILAFPDGRELPILLTVAPIFAGGQVVAAVWALQDITALKQADKEKNEFLAFLSHELLTPLTNLSGWLQAARQAPEMTDQALEVMERNVLRLRQILDDLLDVSRIVHGKLAIEPQPTDLWHAATETLEDFAPALKEKNVRLVTQPPAEPLVVNADPRRLRQVVGNLVSNAIKFTDPGGTITVSATREGEMAKLSVQDTGKGISAEDLPRLFAPFRQVRRAPEIGGVGLGLALVRGIVERHGGRVSAASPGEGRGSTFTIALPLAGS